LGQIGVQKASVGSSRPWKTGTLSRACFLIACLSTSSIAHARCRQIDIAAGPLSRGLVALASQTAVDIASTESGLQNAPANAVSGCLTASQALARLTRGTGFRAVTAGKGSFRLIRIAPRSKGPAPTAPTRTPASSPAVAGDIIVTGAKQSVPLLRFPGSVHIATGARLPSPGERRISLDDFVQGIPVIQKTELGVGRNKLFIRGISDSSFNGPTQSTATIYYGDVPLNYAGPQPAINLVDMERVEILEGPQETLYGAGAISGVIRVTPRSPDLEYYGAAASGGLTLTRGAATGHDASLVANIPLIKDRVGLRVVGYRGRDGGFIDDSRRALTNVNSTQTLGARAMLRIEAGDDWSVDTGMLVQNIEAADGHYAETRVGPLARRAFLAEPYDSKVVLARTVIRKSWDNGLEMVSATGAVKTSSSDSFDATRALLSPAALLYQVASDGLLLAHETRLSRSVEHGVSWVAGAALLYDRDAQTRTIGRPVQPVDIIGVTNTARSAALFGEATVPVNDALAVTLGVRATIARSRGEPSVTPRQAAGEYGLLLRRVQPALALSWLVAPRTAVFARVQSGYRTGGIAVARGIGRVANFRSDSIAVGELGLRMEREGPRGIAFSTALSMARWRDIQADLFSSRSQPYTDNIGDADIVALEAAGDWILDHRLSLDFAMLWTQNRTRGTLAGTSPTYNRHLPDTPAFAGNVGFAYRRDIAASHSIELGGRLRYVGRSVLGSGGFLDISQGDFLTAALSATWRWSNVEASIAVENLTDQKESQFAMGNPMSFSFREQTVPLRPRNVRIGLGIGW
jgi:iron complex outermembrane receptor protein